MLRGRQRSLQARYIKLIFNQDYSSIDYLKDEFLGILEEDIKLEKRFGVDVSRYPIVLDNVFRALGFGIFAGQLPTVSGVQHVDHYHLAFDSSRMVLMGSHPDSLLSQIVDVQPLSSRPILGVGHNTWSGADESFAGD